MTPEQARQLLERATPGPWDCVGQDEEYPRVARDGYQDITNDATNFNAPLIAAAPELAELVAGLRYEYAAQVRRGTASPWLYVLSNGHFSKRGSTSVWCKRRVGCENAIRSALKRKDVGADTVEFRIVRRLVSEPEVVE